MQVSSYVALSGQLTLEQRMTTLSQNIANANTPGFKAGIVNFKTLLANAGQEGTAFAASAENTLDNSAGGMTNTGNPLDLAISGTSVFAYQSPQGTYYSRDGRLTVSPDGQLKNLQGDNLLDPSNSPLLINPAVGQATIGRDGSVVQNGQVVGQIGLFEITLTDGYSRRGSSGIAPVAQPTPVSDFTNNSVLQGYVEGSNVNSVTEMVNLIEVSRAFEAVSTFADKTLEAERNAIESLGSR
jgi:flagellar basal-body rod protein FlgF